MYAGTTLLKDSGKRVGVHQRIDRAARLGVVKFIPKHVKFPSLKEILYFEGNNGPDGIKRKGSANDEPWHFIDPTNPNDNDLIIIINDHIYNLAESLKSGNIVRSSFEAAWLAHAIVDGLTPAHHYPLGDKIEELWGKAHDDRKSLKSKLVIRGDGLKDTISKNWQYIGADGVFTAHLLFEAGVASAISTTNFKHCGPNRDEVNHLNEAGFEAIYREAVAKIYNLNMYKEFGKTGWTWHLAKETKTILIPEMIKIVSLAWCDAIAKAKGGNFES